MAGMGVYIVFLTVIGVAALPINRFKLSPDYHANDFVHELSKQSPNYEKVGQFFKGYYLALNGLKDAEFHGNSSAHKTNGEGIRWKDPRRREIAQSVNVSIVLLTPSSDIVEKSLDNQKKEAQRLISNHTDYGQVLNRSRKHHKLDEKISVALPVPQKGKTGRHRSTLLGMASFLVWLIIVGFLFYYFCSNKRYKKYFKLQPPPKKEKLVTKMQVSVQSSEGSSSVRGGRTTEEESSEKKKLPPGKKPEKKPEKKPRKKSTVCVKFASDSSEVPADSKECGVKPAVDSEKERKTRQSLKLLKTLFNKVLSSEAIPRRSNTSQSSSVDSSMSVKSSKDPSSRPPRDRSSDRIKLKFAARESPVHLDLKRSPRTIPASRLASQVTQLTAIGPEPRPFFPPKPCRGFVPMPEPQENPRFSTPLIKEDYDTVTYDGRSPSEKNKEADAKKKSKKCKKKPLKSAVDKPLLDEDFKNLKEPLVQELKEAKKSCLARKIQKNKVAFSRVIKVQTYVLKSESDKFDKCFHVFDDGSPWFRIYRKSKTPMNSPANDPLYKFPKGKELKGKEGKGAADKKQNYSIAILLKQKLKQKK